MQTNNQPNGSERLKSSLRIFCGIDQPTNPIGPGDLIQALRDLVKALIDDRHYLDGSDYSPTTIATLVFAEVDKINCICDLTEAQDARVRELAVILRLFDPLHPEPIGYMIRLAFQAPDQVNESDLATDLESLAKNLEANPNYLNGTPYTVQSIKSVVSPIWERLAVGSSVQDRIRAAINRLDSLSGN